MALRKRRFDPPCTCDFAREHPHRLSKCATKQIAQSLNRSGISSITRAISKFWRNFLVAIGILTLLKLLFPDPLDLAIENPEAADALRQRRKEKLGRMSTEERRQRKIRRQAEIEAEKEKEKLIDELVEGLDSPHGVVQGSDDEDEEDGDSSYSDDDDDDDMSDISDDDATTRVI